jgi:hypothetical protein
LGGKTRDGIRQGPGPLARLCPQQPSVRVFASQRSASHVHRMAGQRSADLT